MAEPEPDPQTPLKTDDISSALGAKPKLRRFSPAGKSILRKSLRTSYAKSKVKIQEQYNKMEESPSKLQNNNADSTPISSEEVAQEGQGSLSTSTLADQKEQEQIVTNANNSAHATIQSDARFVIETTLRKSAGILSNFTENTISKSGTNFTSLLQTEKFGIPSNAAMKKNRPWCDSTPSVQCSVSVAHRKKPDMSKLPKNIAELLKDDSLHSVMARGGRPTPKRYHSKKMALKQQCSDDTSSSKIDLPVARIKSTSSGESRAPKIVVVSGPLKLDSVDQHGAGVKTPPENAESRMMHNPNVPYRRLNHMPIIQSIKDAIEKVHHNSNKLSKDQNGERGSGGNSTKKVTLGVDKGAAFVLGPKTKHPYYNTFGGVKDTKWLKESPSNCKWVINIGNFHDNEISFSLVDDNLTITGFRQPSLKYPEGQTVSEAITIPPGLEVNNLRIYRSNNANELLVLEEVVPPPSQPQESNNFPTN